ncbi:MULTISPECIES: hypothetical protein [Metabacillus]|jgi:hypothetical protein|uniref:YodN n=1 Tax=Metabacillus rhizolycopersici TaxID=2875709 RepID=A0ABS7ULM7_9BACI|nr:MULTISPECIES: hypothetical protein [Metabacillus]MBZ5749220.1 hypothetical protein [Metabacillus rhizolycopersici]MCM3652009.1 hypothetical protein [Metabacillus litoralis]
MNNKNKPKFKIGDIVVISIYGTIGTITKLHQIEKHFVYEVNHGEVLFFENALQLYSDYEGTIIEMENISIEVLYQIGDIVLVKGYGNSLFRIVGIRTEVWRYADDGWEELTYELTRMADGAWLEAIEEEISLMISNEEAEIIMQQFQLNNQLLEDGQDLGSYFIDQTSSSETTYESNEITDQEKMIDELLDIYNDYLALYQMFQDPEYKDMMNFILTSLKRYRDPNVND